MSVLSLSSAPGRNRIRNLLIRSQTLYPVELRAHFLKRINPTRIMHKVQAPLPKKHEISGKIIFFPQYAEIQKYDFPVEFMKPKE